MTTDVYGDAASVITRTGITCTDLGLESTDLLNTYLAGLLDELSDLFDRKMRTSYGNRGLWLRYQEYRAHFVARNDLTYDGEGDDLSQGAPSTIPLDFDDWSAAETTNSWSAPIPPGLNGIANDACAYLVQQQVVSRQTPVVRVDDFRVTVSTQGVLTNDIVDRLKMYGINQGASSVNIGQEMIRDLPIIFTADQLDGDPFDMP